MMSDDDRDIDIESDVGVVPVWHIVPSPVCCYIRFSLLSG